MRTDIRGVAANGCRAARTASEMASLVTSGPVVLAVTFTARRVAEAWALVTPGTTRCGGDEFGCVGDVKVETSVGVHRDGFGRRGVMAVPIRTTPTSKPADRLPGTRHHDDNARSDGPAKI